MNKLKKYLYVILLFTQSIVFDMEAAQQPNEQNQSPAKKQFNGSEHFQKAFYEQAGQKTANGLASLVNYGADLLLGLFYETPTKKNQRLLAEIEVSSAEFSLALTESNLALNKSLSAKTDWEIHNLEAQSIERDCKDRWQFYDVKTKKFNTEFPCGQRWDDWTKTDAMLAKQRRNDMIHRLIAEEKEKSSEPTIEPPKPAPQPKAPAPQPKTTPTSTKPKATPPPAPAKK